MIKEEWLNEPDRIEFQYKGFDCLIQRNIYRGSNPDDFLGNLGGYVALPPSHPYHGKNYQDIDIVVHGGLTCSGECQGLICHTPRDEEAKLDNVWWIGFNCAHYDDLAPGIYALRKPGGILCGPEYSSLTQKTYKNIEFVKNEIEYLVYQLELLTINENEK